MTNVPDDDPVNDFPLGDAPTDDASETEGPGRTSERFSPGDEVGPYTLVAFLGRGGTGEVWHATETEGQAEVALKIPLRPAFVRHLRAEGLFLEQVAHPNVARFIAADLKAETPWLATELIDGTPLRALCRGTIQPPAATLLCDQLLAGLEAIHAAGILHLDLKPENVIVQPDGKVKIVDLGLGRATTAFMEEVYLSVSLVSRVPPVAGTLAYMAPEQRKGKPTDARTDLFAFGILLHELLTGELPQPGLGVLKLRPELAPRWDAAIAALTHPDPARRPADTRAARHRVSFTLADKRRLPVVQGGHEPRDLTRFDEAAFALASPYSPGMVIGDGYELVAPLGRGGFGEVWRARRGEEQVALKLALSDAAEKGLQVEAEIAARIDHPGIPDLIADHTDLRPPHIVFALVEGLSLRLLVTEEQRLPLRSLFRLFAGMLDAVRACAEAEVVHMDLKPEHFLVTWKGEEAHVSLIDFGLAAHVPQGPSSVQDSLTSKTNIRGTLDYMAPEQRVGQVGPPVDVYALGVCFFELLTFNLPKGPQAPRRIRSEIPPEIDALVVAMLDQDPARRPSLEAARRVIVGAADGDAQDPRERAVVQINPLARLLFPIRRALRTPQGILAAAVLSVVLVLVLVFVVPRKVWEHQTRAFTDTALTSIVTGTFRDHTELKRRPYRRGKVLIVTEGIINSRMGVRPLVRVHRGWGQLPLDLRATTPAEVGTLLRFVTHGPNQMHAELIDMVDRVIVARLPIQHQLSGQEAAALLLRYPTYTPPPGPTPEQRLVFTRNEAAAVKLLKELEFIIINGEQTDLADLAKALRSKATPDGHLLHAGYRIEMARDPKAKTWLAVARPLNASLGRFEYAVGSHQLQIVRSRGPIPLSKTGRIPASLVEPLNAAGR